MKNIIITLSLAATVICQADPIQVSVTGTADATNMGYTAGVSYTFTWIVNDGYTGGSGDAFNSSANQWWGDITADPLLWTSFSGDGLAGTYSRPTGTSLAPREVMSSFNSSLSLTARNDDLSSSSMGLTVDGSEVFSVWALLNIPGLDFSDTTFVNPAGWLADYTDTYTLSGGTIEVMNESANSTLFTPTSATIEAIPEPATLAFVGIFGGGLWLVRRYFPSV